MGYLIKAPLGLGLFFGGIVLFNIKLVSLLETGTCASGNTPYQIAQPCPSGTGTDILLLMASIFGGLIGVGLFAWRGNPPWDKNRPVNLASDFSFPFFAWGVAFTATGATALIAGLTDEAVKQASGAQLGALIVGGVFLVMGVPALILSLRYLLKDFGRRGERPQTITAGGSGMASGGAMSRMSAGLDQTRAAQQLMNQLPWGSTGSASSGGGTAGQIAKLERLQRLRQSGALTDAEFEREKAKVLSE
jgi:putative oligomerization/nucleic acid binding protein